MNEPQDQSAQVSCILQHIYEGMAVYDQLGEQIGTVEFVYLGELIESNEPFGIGEASSPMIDGSAGSLIEEFATAIVLTEEVPDVWRERFLSHGFIRISSTGWFSADYYVMPSQIASVNGDYIALCVGRDKLVRA